MTNFKVVSQDTDGDPLHCTYCVRSMKHLVVLPITGMRVIVCAYCVLAMANALAAADGALP